MSSNTPPWRGTQLLAAGYGEVDGPEEGEVVEAEGKTEKPFRRRVVYLTLP